MTIRSPYREGTPLATRIAPDRRLRNAALLIVAGMVAGIALLEGSRRILPTFHGAKTPHESQTALGALTPVKLTGPDGDLRVPSGEGLSVVYVWLQGCQDCMPAFEAMRDGKPCEGHVINVAYGEASPTWAGEYRVRRNLVYDASGAGVVRPLGIGSFTTLVMTPSGQVLHRDRPDEPGYEERMRPYCDSIRAR